MMDRALGPRRLVVRKIQNAANCHSLWVYLLTTVRLRETLSRKAIWLRGLPQQRHEDELIYRPTEGHHVPRP